VTVSDHRTLIHERVELARAGDNPTVVGRMGSGWAVLADHQFLRGYCMLLPDPVVGHLTDLDLQQRAQYLVDMSRIGDALLAVTDADRINFEILGNASPALHAHVFPRYPSEPPELRSGPAWWYPPSVWDDGPRFSEDAHANLRDALGDWLAADDRARSEGLAADGGCR
jgi:diadenosine tetraphosphate (Ap4A) HIT family hydrolase